MQPKYHRILLKISGEMLGGKKGQGFDREVIEHIIQQISEIYDLGVQVAIVIGGGNIFRGTIAKELGIGRVAGDHMGMLATVINSICLQESLERYGKKETRVMTSFEIKDFAEPYVRRRAIRHLEKGRIVIFGGGTGNPYFSTDTAAVLRGQEIKCELVIKGTKVNGVYDKDPVLNADAVRYDSLTFDQTLHKKLKVMDSTAISFSQDNQLPICVLNLNEKDALKKCILGDKKIATWISSEEIFQTLV